MFDLVRNLNKNFSLLIGLLHLVAIPRPQVYYTLTNFKGGGAWPLDPPQCANVSK